MIEQAKSGLANRYQLRNRYRFTGRLVMQTALHIGGGKVTLSHSDSPVVLTPERIPFIPGSSFKGALRSTVEKLVPGLPTSAALSSCALIELDDAAVKEARERKQRICPTVRQSNLVGARRENPGRAEVILEQAMQDLCSTCQLFGSPFAASHVSINDLYMPAAAWHGIIQVRDGVAIERDSEKAKPRLKYDFEVVPSSAEFDLEITLENATLADLQLISVGLSEFVHGFGVVGGKRSRGLGACELKGLKVFALELTGINETERNKRLRNFLLNRQFSSEIDGSQFLETYITTLFEKS